MNEPSKPCRICGAVKPLTEFFADKTHADDRRNECKACARVLQKRFYEANPAANPVSVPPEGKRCKMCGLIKAGTDFPQDPKMADGVKSDCIPCYRAKCRDYSRSNPEACLAYHRRRMSDPAYRAIRNAAGAESAKRHKIQNAARSMVKRRIKLGLIVRQPCEKCGQPNAQAHHDDYSKPLDVRWFCQKHHSELHRRYQ